MDNYLEPFNDVITVNDEKYLVQGEISDPLHMVRSVDDLLEPERDNVQKMYDTEVLEE